MKIDLLKNMPLFRDLPDEALRLLLPAFEEESLAAGSIIFEEGLLSDTLYVIQRGEVEIRKIIGGEPVRYKTIAILAGGEFLGEMAAFQKQPRSAEALARTDVSLLKVKRDDIFRLLKNDVSSAGLVTEFLTSILMSRLRDTTQELATLYETGRLVATAGGIAELASAVMDRLMTDIPAGEAGLFAVWNEFNEEYEIHAERGFGLAGTTYIPPGDPLVAWFLANKTPFLSFDLEGDKRLPPGVESLYKGASMVAAPFMNNDCLSGFLLLVNRSRKNAFSYSRMVLLSAVGGYAALAVENLKHRSEEAARSRLSETKTKTFF